MIIYSTCFIESAERIKEELENALIDFKLTTACSYINNCTKYYFYIAPESAAERATVASVIDPLYWDIVNKTLSEV